MRGLYMFGGALFSGPVVLDSLIPLSGGNKTIPFAMAFADIRN